MIRLIAIVVAVAAVAVGAVAASRGRPMGNTTFIAVLAILMAVAGPNIGGHP